jgi:hypothetical protein
MDEQRFWEIVDASRADKQSAQKRQLRATLAKLDASEVRAFAERYDACFNTLETRRTWGAGLILNAGYCSDDGFEYFRHWIIALGSAAYRAALSDADRLAGYPPRRVDGSIEASFEDFRYVADTVYEKKTGEELIMGHAERTVSGEDFSEYLAEDLARDFPGLWSLHGNDFDASAGAELELTVESLDIEGLGLLRVGDTLVHESFGSGVVLSIFPDGHFDSDMKLIPNGEGATCVFDFVGEQGRCAVAVGGTFHHLWSRP